MTEFTFRHDRAECPENEDDMHVLLRGGVDTHIAVQDGRSYGGGYVVNRYLYESERLTGCQMMSEHRSLKSAKAAALALVGS